MMFSLRHLPSTSHLVLGIAVLFASLWCADDGRGAGPPLTTRWAASVTPENCWREYPRPQMRRDDWLNLNGLWDIAITPAEDAKPTTFTQQILVPFPIESYLGGLRGKLQPEDKAWYRRAFRTPESWSGRRVLLHFGAVDWNTQVWVNGIDVGSHQGGYDPFYFDVTDALALEGDNEIVVAVIDPTDRGFQPRGKQRLIPEGIWYTPVSGVWQTVWLEPVPKSSIAGVRITPNAKPPSVTVKVLGRGENESHVVEVAVLDSGEEVASKSGAFGQPVTLPIQHAKFWSPSEPFLYDLQIRLLRGKETLDEVQSYFGLRSVALGQDKNGLTRIMLNGEPVFQFGALDQGYWPDGLYTAPSDAAMKSDLETLKRLGCNMVRKHVKVEPARWYYWCDRIGLLVWQDMPNGDQHAPWPKDGVEITRSPASAQQYRRELAAMVDFCHNSPSVIVWVPFNEGWGQFDTRSVTAWLKSHDPSRLVIAASGGNDQGVGDIDDDHFYPGPGSPPAERGRAAVLGEFGGFGLPVSGHTWQDEANWGYRTFRNADELTKAYVEALAKLRPLVESHLSAAVYTQVTDVEIEVNGLMTYDREVLKLDESAIRAAHDRLFEPLPELSAAQRIAASTLAWWRFEDVKPENRVPDIAGRMGAIGARDWSGRNNHLYAFWPQGAPSAGRARYAGRIKGKHTQNENCLDDTVPPAGNASVRDLFTEPHLSRTHMDMVDRYPFSAWTIEASFSVVDSRHEQAVVAKGGHSVPAPLQLGLFGNEGRIQVQIVDGESQSHTVQSRFPANAGKWYHVAATCDGQRLRLYIRPDDEADYELHGETGVTGALQQNAGTWVIGRGFRGTDMGYDFVGMIDEVRVSTIARDRSDFLFAP